jgi:hypothetical protein
MFGEAQNVAEWRFLFRIDYLNVTGEERDLKGTLYTDGEPPTPEDILGFLRQSGFDVKVRDRGRLVFFREGDDPLEIRIAKIGSGEREHDDAALRAIVEQFRKRDPAIGG